jgi:hypothetical protein
MKGVYYNPLDHAPPPKKKSWSAGVARRMPAPPVSFITLFCEEWNYVFESNRALYNEKMKKFRSQSTRI